MKPHKHRDVIIAWAEGKTIQVNQHGPFGHQWTDLTTRERPRWAEHMEYRIKPAEFPPLPAGYTYHNPLNLTAEEFGCDEGWRPALTTEKFKIHESEGWSIRSNQWSSMSGSVEPVCYSYSIRTKLPLPEFPKPRITKKVPLDASDFDKMPAVWLRPNWDEKIRWNVSSYTVSGVTFGASNGREWKDMIEDLSYSADKLCWHPCYKEIEVDAE